MTPINAADPASKVAYPFTDVGKLHDAIKTYQFIPLRADGTPFKTQYLEAYDGYVLDGAPINVWMDGVWLEGQRESMELYWSSGQVPRPPTNILNFTPTTPMPEDIRQRTEAYQRSQAGLFGLSPTALLIAVGALGYFLFLRR